MEYLIHFDDGSEGYLSHHGVKGMKWGVWNEETRGRYNGISKRQASETAKQLRNQKVVGPSNVKLAVETHKRLSDAREKYLKADPLIDEWNSNPDIQEKYKTKMGHRYANSDDPEDHKRMVWLNIFDDLDQGGRSESTDESSFDLFVKDRVKDPEKYYMETYKAKEEYRKAIKSEVDRVLGKHSNRITKDRYGGKSTLSEQLSDEVFRITDDERWSKRKEIPFVDYDDFKVKY